MLTQEIQRFRQTLGEHFREENRMTDALRQTKLDGSLDNRLGDVKGFLDDFTYG